MNRLIKKLLIPFFIIFLFLTQLHATEANKPNTEIVLVVAQDGGNTFFTFKLKIKGWNE